MEKTLFLVKAREVWFLAEKASVKDYLDNITGRTSVIRLFDRECVSVRDSDIEILPETNFRGYVIDSVEKAINYLRELDSE